MPPNLHTTNDGFWYSRQSRQLHHRYRILASIGLLSIVLVTLISVKLVIQDKMRLESRNLEKRQFQLGSILGRLSQGVRTWKPDTSSSVSTGNTVTVDTQVSVSGTSILGNSPNSMTNFRVRELSNSVHQPDISATSRQTESSELLQMLTDLMRDAVDMTPSDPASAKLTYTASRLKSPLLKHPVLASINERPLNGHLSLLNHVCNMVVQVAEIDPDAAAALVDTILNALSVNPLEVTSRLSAVAVDNSVEISKLLPLILPAIAIALEDTTIKHYKTMVGEDSSKALENIISQGRVIIGQIFASDASLSNKSFHDILNEVAKIMCSAAGILKSSLCVISRILRDMKYEITIPCEIEDVKSLVVLHLPSKQLGDSGIYNSQPQQSTWSILTSSQEGIYTFLPDSQTTMRDGYHGRLTRSQGTIDAAARCEKTPIPTLEQYGDSPSMGVYTEPTKTKCRPILNPLVSSSRSMMPTPATTTRCPARIECSCNESRISAITTTPYSSPGASPCLHSGFPCAECPGGWFCPPQETPAQLVACGIGWPCYHCSYGLFCIPSGATKSQSLRISSLTVSESTITSPPSPTVAPPIGSHVNIGSYSTSSSTITTSTSVANKMPYDWQYVGCFKDENNHVLQGTDASIMIQGNMPRNKCIDHCNSKGYQFAATKNGNECWCGKSMQSQAAKLADVACGSLCSGSGSECCGGVAAVSVYTGTLSSADKGQYGSISALLKALKLHKQAS